MRAYVAVTGLVFLLLAGSHVARLMAEGGWLLREPIFILTTLAGLVLAVWAAWLLLRKSVAGPSDI